MDGMMKALQIAKEALETIAKWDLYRDEREFVELALKSINEAEGPTNENNNTSGPTWKRQKHNSYEPL